VTQLIIVYKKKNRIDINLNFQWMQSKKTWRKWDPWYLRRWILTTHLGAWINNNRLHANLQLIVFQKGMNFLQHLWVIYMHDNEDPFIRQKPICKNKVDLIKLSTWLELYSRMRWLQSIIIHGFHNYSFSLWCLF